MYHKKQYGDRDEKEIRKNPAQAKQNKYSKSDKPGNAFANFVPVILAALFQLLIGKILGLSRCIFQFDNEIPALIVIDNIRKYSIYL